MTLAPRTIDEILARLPRPEVGQLPAPSYACPTAWDIWEQKRYCAGLAVESMRRHMTDEGWQLFDGLCSAGYALFGQDIEADHEYAAGSNVTDVRMIVGGGAAARPHTVVVQDRREYEGLTADRSQDPAMRFRNVSTLRDHDDIFKLTVLKDSHQTPQYHHDTAAEMGAHCWIVYYHPRIVAHLAPYTRPQHLIRTWHTLDKKVLPPWQPRDSRSCCLISGAVSKVYPLRVRLLQDIYRLPGTNFLPHPGYHRQGCCTPAYLQALSKYRVSVCTSSIYGYCLRKLIESTAVGCIVITDLPVDDVVPGIDENLVRIHPSTPTQEIGMLIRKLYDTWDEERQRHFARLAVEKFDLRAEGERLAIAIEFMRKDYNSSW